jgi:hypothetical protein
MGKGKAMVISVAIMALVMTTGCDSLRFAPGEVQKQNVYLHHRTVQSAALKAQGEPVSETLRALTTQAAKQSDAIVAYYGLPQEMPATENIEDILSEQNVALAEDARSEALQRPDPWDAADNLLELSIALAGVFGGVFGARAARALQAARQKSDALREVIRGNQLFKKENPEWTEDFKKAHQVQSEPTRRLVAALK